ncbi:MAG TPA: VWA domain-containing protein [Deltaproteobacteria bacterium]|nr:VWA domain-containing protein [Deltaproteobacteria bacterium]
MQRWHLTLGLTGLAIGAASLAPSLKALIIDVPTPSSGMISEVVPPPPSDPLPPASTGSLIVDAGLDRTAVLAAHTTERFLTVRVRAPEDVGETVRRPVDLAVVLDASGSMSARGKIDYAKRAAKLIANHMEPEDSYALVVFNDDARTIVPSTKTTQDRIGTIERAIDRIYEGGGTNLYAGMDRGAWEVQEALAAGDVGRVIVLSDGNANVGVTDGSAMARFAAGLVSDGVTLSTIGLGLDYNEDLLAHLADMGGGSYDFVDDPRELDAVFSDELARTASVVARNTAVTIELPEGVEPLEVIGWDARRVDGGWQVFLGDVYAGESRKIVARVRVSGDTVGQRRVAEVTADYQDLGSDSLARTHVTATATVTSDASQIETSLDRERAIEASRAFGNWYLEMSTRAFESGDKRRSQSLLGRGRQVLQEASRELSAPALAEDARVLEEQSVILDTFAPTSTEGKKHIKGNKERARVLVR